MEHPPQEHHNDQVSQALSALAPGPLDRPDPARALRAFKSRIERRDEITMFGITLTKNMKRAAAILGAVALLAGLLAVPQVQALASEFLSIFRVEKFVLINVDEARMEQIAAAMEDHMGFDEEDKTPPVEPQDVGSVGEAAGLAGFSPLTTDQHGAVTGVQVSSASEKTFTPNVEDIRAVYEALDLDPKLIPDNIDGQPFDVAIAPGIAVTYAGSGGSGELVFAQTPSPTVNVPDGADMKQLGKAMLMLLGMNEQQATEMSDSIDWATTLVVPVPLGTEAVQEVNVRGAKGLMFEGHEEDDKVTMLVWQENGYVMVVGGRSATDVTNFAESLK